MPPIARHLMRWPRAAHKSEPRAEESQTPGRSAVCEFEGETPFAQLGINLSVLRPGEAMSQYHWEADQEDFLVLAGQALLIIEGEERPLRACGVRPCGAGASAGCRV
jgi:uncharacterized cupin superfamily protein